MFARDMKYPAKDWGRPWFRRPLVLALASGLIWSGGLVWIDNAVAVIPDLDPETFVTLELPDTFAGNDGRPEHHLGQTGRVPGGRPATQSVIHGNGGQDDNREEAFLFRPSLGRTVAAHATAAVTTFHERRTAAAYTDFGHLKVMPAGRVASDIFVASLYAGKGCPCDMGGLCDFVNRPATWHRGARDHLKSPPV